MTKFFPFIVSLSAFLFISCGSNPYGKVGFAKAPKIVNVSSYDPKPRLHSGRSYTPLSQQALRDNGALGQIARCGKGYDYDSKCSDFLAGAERCGLLLGSYYYVTAYNSATAQADRFIARLRGIKRSRGLRTRRIMLVGDIDTRSSVSHIVSFVNRIHQLTGTYPMLYIENSEGMRRRLRAATSSQKRILRKCPYWLALYGHTYPGIPTPKKLARASGIWKTWALWQYGGVEWEHRHHSIKHYSHGRWRSPRYFGNLSQPLERNAFNGDIPDLVKFWRNYGWEWS